jgi:hypothetical protein
MAKQIYLLVNTVYTEDDDPNAVNVLGTFETPVAANIARRKILQRQHRALTARLLADVARAQRSMKQNPETPAQQAFFAAKAAWLANPKHPLAKGQRLQKLAPTLGLAWSSSDHASDLAALTARLAMVADFEVWLAHEATDLDPRIVTRKLR